MADTVEQIVDCVGKDPFGDTNIVVGSRLFSPRILPDV